MRIVLYRNISPYNQVGKKFTVRPWAACDGNLRAPISITNPVIEIEFPRSIGTEHFNYVQIKEFERYYFVTGIVCGPGNLITVSCHVDVLETFKDIIADTDAVVKRNENRYNLYLDDGIFKAYQNTKHKMIRFPNGFNDFSYILALAGNDDYS